MAASSLLEQLPAGAEKLPTCNPPCRSVLTVVLTSEARLYRYLTCGGQSTKSWKSFWKDLHFVEKVSGIETQGRPGGLGHCSRVSRVKQSESAESSVEDCLIGVSAAPTFALPPVPFCQTPTEKAQDANARPNKLEKPSRSDDTHLRLTQTDSRVKIEIWESSRRMPREEIEASTESHHGCMQCNAMQCKPGERQSKEAGARSSPPFLRRKCTIFPPSIARNCHTDRFRKVHILWHLFCSQHQLSIVYLVSPVDKILTSHTAARLLFQKFGLSKKKLTFVWCPLPKQQNLDFFPFSSLCQRRS